MRLVPADEVAVEVPWAALLVWNGFIRFTPRLQCRESPWLAAWYIYIYIYMYIYIYIYYVCTHIHSCVYIHIYIYNKSNNNNHRKYHDSRHGHVLRQAAPQYAIALCWLYNITAYSNTLWYYRVYAILHSIPLVAPVAQSPPQLPARRCTG